jgi:hypothetical protein
MPYKEPLRILILPEDIAIPPPVGQSALVLNPGPPPEIDFYTGDALETVPAKISTSAGRLNLIAPDLGASPVPSIVLDGRSNGAITLTADAGIVFSGGYRAAVGDVMAILESTQNTAINGQVNTAMAGFNCGFPFTAPPSGRILINIKVRAQINATAAVRRVIIFSPRLGTGSTVGAGTALTINGITTPADSVAWEFDNCGFLGTSEGQASSVFFKSGLTAGNPYNIEIWARINSAVTANYDIVVQACDVIPLH